jgi:methylenetetrahydrofolate reductase (NADPH)
VTLLATASIELTPREVDTHLDAVGQILPAGTRVLITALDNVPLGAQLTAAERVHDAGFAPVPHIAARSYESLGELQRHLARLVERASVAELLLIAGGRSKPAGQIESSLEVLRSGVVPATGVRRIAVAGHPEGIHGIASADLSRALDEKNRIADEHQLEMRIVTQFALAAPAYVSWERAARAAGNGLPVTAGLAGVVSARKLLRFAISCGVGPSIEILRKRAGGMFKLAAGTWSPDPVLDGIADSVAADPACLIDAVHFYAFGNVVATAEWLRDRLASG